MKLLKSLSVNGEAVGLVREYIWLDMATPGRADFTVRSPKPLSGVVQFYIGAAGRGTMAEFFTGFIVDSHTVDASQQRLFCRELAAALWTVIPVSIRNASMRDILGVYARKTGLSFTVPDKDYGDTPCPAFQTVGSGIHGLDSLGPIFGIEDYIWQQQGDGQVFAGSWQDSKWAGKPFTVQETAFENIQVDGTRTLQAVPGLRPGVMLNGRYVTSLQLYKHFMVVTCAKRLNG